MRDRVSHGAFMRRFGAVLALAVALGALAGSGLWSAPTAQAQATTVTVQKELIGPNGQAVQGDLSGYVFTLQGNGLTIPLPATNAAGQTAIGVAAGTYTITETPRPGSNLVGFFLNNVQVASFTVGANPVTITARNQVAGTGTVTVTKQIVDAAGAQVANADLSGFEFRLTGPNNFNQALTTTATGTVTFTNLAPGTYTINETSRSGFTLQSLVVNGTIAQNGAQFQVNTAAVTIVARNQAATTGNVTITKNIVDASGAAVATGDRSGFRFTFVQGNTTVTSDATTAAGTASVSLPPGTYTFNEQARTGCTFATATVNNGTIGNGGTFTVAAGQSYAIVVNNTCTGSGSGNNRTEQLFVGCNNIAITHPAGTPIATVAQGITGTVESIFRYDNAQGRFFGWAPNVPAFAVDYPSVVARLEPVFICMRTAGQLVQPAV